MRAILSAVLLACAATAQLPFVSPTTANGVEGSASNSFPFTNGIVRRYQQVHDDLPQLPLTLSGLSFRFKTPTSVTTYTGTRTIDMELLIGNGPNNYAATSRLLDANFTSPPTIGIPRTIVNWGPQGLSLPTPGPQAFHTNMDLPLASPYVWIPVTPTLTWEAVIYSNSVGTGSFTALDVDQGSFTTATGTTVGTGCICTGRTVAQTAVISMADMQGYLGFGIGVTNGTPNSQIFSSIGFTNPNLAVAGLCSNVYTDLTFFIPSGTTSATGSLANSAGVGFHIPNGLSGAQLFFQNFTFDPTLPGIPMCASSGVMFTVPAPNTTKIVQVSRAFDSSGTTTATTGLFFANSNIGYGLPVEFY